VIQLRAADLAIGGGPFLVARQEQLAALTFQHAAPAVFEKPASSPPLAA
jgi:hypothetical protein